MSTTIINRARTTHYDQVMGTVMIVHGMRNSEHAHIISKWRLAMNLVVEYVENV